MGEKRFSEGRFRQARTIDENDALSLTVRRHPVSLKNWSRTGVGFESHEDLRGVSTIDLLLKCGELTVYCGKAEIRNARQIEAGSFLYGAAFTEGLCQVEAVTAAQLAKETISVVSNKRNLLSPLKPEACRAIMTLLMTLKELKLRCDDVEQSWRKLPRDNRIESEDAFLLSMAPHVIGMFSSLNYDLDQHIEVLSLPKDSIYYQIFSSLIYPYFELGDFPRRAVEKPRGYAGDFEMMNHIYRNGFEGESVFGKLLHNYVANDLCGRSVRFRKDYLGRYYREALKNKSGLVSVLSVASGPAVEAQDIVSELSSEELSRLKITLFDLDQDALGHAQNKLFEIAIRQKKSINVDFVNASVKSFLVGKSPVSGTFDLIYSAGLYDYLDNPTSKVLTHSLARQLNNHGTLLLGNFVKSDSSKAMLNLLLQWILINKSESEMMGWADGLTGFETHIEHLEPRSIACLVLKRNALN